MFDTENLISSCGLDHFGDGDDDLDDNELLGFALGFASVGPVGPTADNLVTEFGDLENILAAAPEDLHLRGGLTSRGVAVLKLLHAFRADSQRGQLVN